jgi:hypothetical protein
MKGEVRCECGYVHDLDEMPCPTLWRAFRDADYGDLLKAERARDQLETLKPGSPEYDRLLWADEQADRILTHVFECPRCGRLVWNRGEEHPDRIFAFERERADSAIPEGRPRE